MGYILAVDEQRYGSTQSETSTEWGFVPSAWLQSHMEAG